jgi:hypothetical protein
MFYFESKNKLLNSKKSIFVFFSFGIDAISFKDPCQFIIASGRQFEVSVVALELLLTFKVKMTLPKFLNRINSP